MFGLCEPTGHIASRWHANHSPSSRRVAKGGQHSQKPPPPPRRNDCTLILAARPRFLWHIFELRGAGSSGECAFAQSVKSLARLWIESLSLGLSGDVAPPLLVVSILRLTRARSEGIEAVCNNTLYTVVLSSLLGCGNSALKTHRIALARRGPYFCRVFLCNHPFHRSHLCLCVLT